jgi:hypothetical protein
LKRPVQWHLFRFRECCMLRTRKLGCGCCVLGVYQEDSTLNEWSPRSCIGRSFPEREPGLHSGAVPPQGRLAQSRYSINPEHVCLPGLRCSANGDVATRTSADDRRGEHLRTSAPARPRGASISAPIRQPQRPHSRSCRRGKSNL